MNRETTSDFVLGIDLGASSVGWAIVSREDGNPARVIRAGARVFEAGMEGDLASGQEESRNKKRRDARLHRRLLERRGRRLRKIFRLLQQFGLLPPGGCRPPDERQNLLDALDRAILVSPWFAAKQNSAAHPEPQQVLPYLLRAAALDERLEPHLLGRALYHLAQRRGFLSNRRQTSSRRSEQDEERGKVSQGIHELRQEMQTAGARTLGEYFSRLAPSQLRIRGRWTARSMYLEEFEKIWEAQTGFHPELLTAERNKLLFRAIYHQRPLKFPRNLVGQCELEPDRRRAPAYLLLSQRFRLLQKVNDLQVAPPEEVERPLSEDERARLLAALEMAGDMTFSQIRKFLHLRRGAPFNLERGGEEKLPGNRTFAQFFEVLEKRWLAMSRAEQDRLVEYVYSFEKPDKLAAAAQKKWGLEAGAAQKLAEVSLEAGHLSFSRRAMEKLLPLLEAGMPYATVRRQLYPERFRPVEPKALLPPVQDCHGILGEIRNPAVMRSLTELRKVANAVVRAYGKPAEIRVELARDLRNTKKQREAASERNRANQRARDKARADILQQMGLAQPSRDDIRKVLLAEECHWQCPYTGRPISMQALFGQEPQFDIEHIIPFSRSLDNSFVNLTLCHNEENRNRKHNKTPFQGYEPDAERYQQILDRVKKFSGKAASEKLRRFRMTGTELAEFLEDFRQRQLNDTRYASRVAAGYLGLLYGGRDDASGTRRVRTTLGQITAHLRNEWQLNGILRDGPTSNGGAQPKTRDDHRHHAVDAIVVALTEDGTIQRLSRAAEQAPLEGRRRFAPLPAPWPDFVDSVRAEIQRIVVSHRPSKKVSGALHEETNYAAPFGPEAEKDKHVRKPLASLSKSEVEDIVDPVVRRLVVEKLAELGAEAPKKVFSKEENLPCLPGQDGRRTLIKKVRIRKKLPTVTIGSGPTARHVAHESNHHVEIFAELGPDGEEVEWDGFPVPMAEAYQRKKQGVPVVKRDFGPERKFTFSLAPGEVLECESEPGRPRLLVCRGSSQYTTGQVVVVLLPIEDAKKNPKLLRVVPNTLRKWNARKVAVSPLGEVIEAHD